MTRVAIYTRVSQDRDENETSTERQEESCRQYAAARGWEVVEPVFRDSGISAYDRKAVRPAYEQLRLAVATGNLDVVLVWRSDRIYRRVGPFMEFIDWLEELGVAYAAVEESFDSQTPAGRFALQMLGAFAEYESASISQRVRARRASEARAGRAHPGGKRAFGYNRDGTTVKQEAELLQEAAERFLNGESLRRIAMDWNERGIATTAGKRWASSTLSQTLKSPRLAGFRTHTTKIGKGTSTTLFKGDWEPIFDEDLHYRLVEALGDSRRTATRRSLKRHLLTNLLRCGVCGHGMHSRGEDFKAGKLRYACVKRPESDHCGSVTIDLHKTEQQVFEDVLTAMDTELLRMAAEADDLEQLRIEAERALADDQTALEDLSRDFYVERLITRDEFVAARGPLVARIAENEATVARLRRQPTPSDMPQTAADLEEWWQEATVEERRAFLETILEAVIVGPVRYRGYSKWDPDRISYVWKA